MPAVLFPGDAVTLAVEMEPPEPTPGEVLIRLTKSGVCGTDVHYWRETPQQRGHRRDVVPGHEAVGVVDCVGPGVVAFGPGDRVVVGMLHIGCGRCRDCASGNYSHCLDKQVLGRTLHGSYGQYVCVPDRAVYRLPDALTDSVAVMTACNLSTAHSAVRKAALSAGGKVAIFGLGGVGLCALMAAATHGVEVTAIDPIAGRRDMAASLGATLVSDPEDFHASLAAGHTRGYDATIECSGHPGAQADSIRALVPGGRSVVVGGGGRFTFRAEELLARELTLVGSSVCPADLFYDVLDFAATHHRELEGLLGPTFGITDAEQALRHSADGGIGKPIFDWPH
ncbi:hypothetical protein EXU48_19845 [Occultella glacieicola]|uniref:Enoyl reductase (ER) domain-containing protein n=1 Tax=Occultella glacieicola TaxID=2518684 RepID=A0ABY2DYV5_9MICO|nr:alcohol dehydrogenase catalytic domain-containing protein [Occultella glacieicola]TDE89677.1 hypothetical protein EXU48_19845 [Occultella glacieicola]